MASNRIHGACVDLDGKGVLLLGPSGSGKSDLALRLIDAGATLVSDDQVDLVSAGQGERAGVLASAPAEIRGLLEIRGIGIVQLETVETTPLALVVQLVAPDRVERLPDAAVWICQDLEIPMITLTPFEASAVAKLRLAVSAPNMNDGAMIDDAGPTHER